MIGSIIVIILGMLIAFAEADNRGWCFIAVTSICVGGVFLHNSMIKEYPTAIDVYRGKTTLEITYKDSIPVDTVVVFKK